MLSSLAREAAELLWEMVATEDVGDATQQMRENAAAIQVCDKILQSKQLWPAFCLAPIATEGVAMRCSRCGRTRLPFRYVTRYCGSKSFG